MIIYTNIVISYEYTKFLGNINFIYRLQKLYLFRYEIFKV